MPGELLSRASTWVTVIKVPHGDWDSDLDFFLLDLLFVRVLRLLVTVFLGARSRLFLVTIFFLVVFVVVRA